MCLFITLLMNNKKYFLNSIYLKEKKNNSKYYTSIMNILIRFKIHLGWIVVYLILFLQPDHNILYHSKISTKTVGVTHGETLCLLSVCVFFFPIKLHEFFCFFFLYIYYIAISITTVLVNFSSTICVYIYNFEILIFFFFLCAYRCSINT